LTAARLHLPFESIALRDGQPPCAQCGENSRTKVPDVVTDSTAKFDGYGNISVRENSRQTEGH
jgi:hypothetical protein